MTRHPVRGAVAIVATVALLLVLATRLVPHPVGPARTFDKYRGKAVTTAKSALSSVATVRLAARAGSRDRAFGPYLSVLISDAEASISGVQGTFDSIQPPDVRSDALRARLDTLLSRAIAILARLRIAARRSDLQGLARIAAPLGSLAAELSRFAGAYG